MSRVDDILNKVMVESVMSKLDDESKFILHHWLWMGMSLDDIGPLFGSKFRGRPVTGEDVRYYKNKCLDYIRTMLKVELENPNNDDSVC